MWPDGNYTLPDSNFARKDFAGGYTLFCCLVERNGKTYLLKRYHLMRVEGAVTEISNYERYSKHPILPELVAKLPFQFRAQKRHPLAILVHYYESELKIISLLEVLAAALNLATVFRHFSQDDRIYFDLRPSSLRLDEQGMLRLIDYTDLITPAELIERDRGLPVTNRESSVIPPEGRRYQIAYDIYAETLKDREKVKRSAMRLKSGAYHTFILAGLMLRLLGGFGLRDRAVQSWIRSSSNGEEGSFSQEDQRKLMSLIRNMREQSISRRASLDEVRSLLWTLLEPRIASENGAYFQKADRARRLLGTITYNAQDPFSSSVHGKLDRFWRKM